ncbi:MAG: TVP38/TMEM64 family protein, partial [Deltaproteobacteria bacterium]|nr:TVP38/TMEM64 family protein [Deltaproteobacteria bacterium]
VEMRRDNVWKYWVTLSITAGGVVAAFLFFTALLCSLMVESDWCSWWPHISVADTLEFVKSTGYWGVGVSIGIMVLHSFVPFPAEFVAVANGVVFGPVWGTVITWLGAMIGAFLAFALARKFGQPFVRKMLTKKKAQAVDRWVARHGVGTLFISRFIPVISFNLINYAAALTKISWGTFVWTTGVGILPMTILMVVMGNQIHTLPWSIWILLLLGGFLMFLLLHRYLLKRVH